MEGYEKPYEELGGYDVLAKEKANGRIKRLGFSFHGDKELFLHILNKRQWDFVLLQINYIDWVDQEAEFFYNEVQQEFARVNRGEKRDYLITQYITSLVEHSGYDGLCFRSSLVKDGTNYLIFQPTDCTAVSSKICYLNGVQYQYFQFRP